jgi:hypothetical protein
VRAVFPDAGTAALLKNRWGAPDFLFASLNDRSVVQPGDAAVVVCSPDPQGVESAQRVAAACEEAGVACVLLNPRLASGDAGVGLNARRLRDRFVGTFSVVYSLRPFGQGTVFRRSPGAWKVFGPDKGAPGRLVLLSESWSRPAADDVFELLLAAEGGQAKGEGGAQGSGGFLDGLARTVASLASFMRQLSN